MTLVLRGITLNEQPISRPLIGRFDERGGTLGRSDDSTLTLPDPQRLISRQQAQVVHNGQQFWIENLSSANVILHNGRPLSTGMRVVLRGGDELRIGGYTLAATFEDDAENATILLGRSGAPPAQAPAVSPTMRPAVPKMRVVPTEILPSTLTEPLDRTFLLALRDAPKGSEPQRLQPPPAPPAPEPPLPRPVTVILEAIVTQPRESEPAPAPVAAPAAPAAALEPMVPASEPIIPEPMAACPDPKPLAVEPMLAAEPVPAAVSKSRKPKAVAQKAKAPEARKTALKPASERSTARPKQTDDALSLWRSFIQGASLEGSAQDSPSAPLMGSAGEMLRIAVSGIQRLIMLRAKSKNDIRAEMTMLQVRDNNPLKFSREPQAALQMLLEPPARGFLAGPAALQAALDDLQSHQAGMAAGMRSVLTSVLGRLDPVKLGLAPRRRWWLNFLRPRRKASLWDKYVNQYESLREEIQGDFERVFGEVFRETYEAKAPLRK